MERKLVISNIAATTQKKHVESFFSEKPPLVDVTGFEIAKPPPNYQPQPYGTVEFLDAANKTQALQRSGDEMRGKAVVMEDFINDEAKPMYFKISKIPLWAKRGTVMETFNRLAPDKVEVTLPMDTTNKKVNKGYGFVFVKSHASFNAIAAAGEAGTVRVLNHDVCVTPGRRGGAV